MDKKANLFRSAYIVYFLIAILFVGIRIMSALGLFSALGGWSDIIFSLLVQIGILFCCSIFLFGKLTNQNKEEVYKLYNFNKISKKCVIICVALGVVVFILNMFASSFFQIIIQLFGYVPTSTSTGLLEYPFWLYILNIILTAICPAICEEIAHRGMLLNAEMTRTSPKKAIIISSVLFGLIHLNIEQVFYAILIGLVLGYLTVMTKSIYPAMIIHFMNNALSVTLSYSSANNLVLGQIFSRCLSILQTHLFLGLFLMIILVAVLLYFFYRLMGMLFISNAKNRLLNSRDIFEKFVKRQFFFMDLDNIKNGVDVKKEMTIAVDTFDLEKAVALPEKEEIPVDKIGVALRFLTFAMTIILTFLTFVWGII